MQQKKPKVWSFAGGKGGAGKSFFVTHFAIALEKMGHKVLIVDMDFSGSTLHTFMGLKKFTRTLNEYFLSPNPGRIEDYISATDFPRLKCIPGETRRHFCTHSSSKWNLDEFVKTLKKCEFDYVLLDLGTGTEAEKLALLAKSDERFVVTQPDPASIEKTYRFYEAYLQSVMGVETQIYSEIWEKYESEKKKGFSPSLNLKKVVESSFSEFSDKLKDKGERPLHLIVNGTRSHMDQGLGFAMQSVTKKYYGWPLHYAGYVEFDNAVWQSVRAMKPLWLEHPHSPVLGQIMSIVKSISPKHIQDAQVLRTAS